MSHVLLDEEDGRGASAPDGGSTRFGGLSSSALFSKKNIIRVCSFSAFGMCLLSAVLVAGADLGRNSYVAAAVPVFLVLLGLLVSAIVCGRAVTATYQPSLLYGIIDGEVQATTASTYYGGAWTCFWTGISMLLLALRADRKISISLAGALAPFDLAVIPLFLGLAYVLWLRFGTFVARIRSGGGCKADGLGAALYFVPFLFFLIWLIVFPAKRNAGRSLWFRFAWLLGAEAAYLVAWAITVPRTWFEETTSDKPDGSAAKQDYGLVWLLLNALNGIAVVAFVMGIFIIGAVETNFTLIVALCLPMLALIVVGTFIVYKKTAALQG